MASSMLMLPPRVRVTFPPGTGVAVAWGAGVGVAAGWNASGASVISGGTVASVIGMSLKVRAGMEPSSVSAAMAPPTSTRKSALPNRRGRIAADRPTTTTVTQHIKTVPKETPRCSASPRCGCFILHPLLPHRIDSSWSCYSVTPASSAASVVWVPSASVVSRSM